jgi:DNA helicase-2/ATP-dependent DNA helicase PcrA
MPLKRQAVLFRTSHHSDALEVELGRRNIPYVKFGGLKFLEAAHIKDVLCVLRWAENPRDAVAGFRVLQLFAGIGPSIAKRLLGAAQAGQELDDMEVPKAAQNRWRLFVGVMQELRRVGVAWAGQVERVRKWYEPVLEERYDSAHVRMGDLEQLEQISGEYECRERFLSELALDPPDISGDHAGPPHLDEDYLILSTIHSAKGQEWDAVYLLNVADGCIPSDMATGHPEQIEEERRLLYVAMTRAKNDLYLVHPQRFFVRNQHRHGDRHVYAPLTRFIPETIVDRFERVARARATRGRDGNATLDKRIDVARRVRDMF